MSVTSDGRKGGLRFVYQRLPNGELNAWGTSEAGILIALCDFCGDRITPLREGNIVFEFPEPMFDTPVEVHFVHKRCDAQYERSVGRGQGAGERFAWDDITDLLGYLIYHGGAAAELARNLARYVKDDRCDASRRRP